MGKKHKHPEHENLERWLVSYADFITLLFATFTALFALASADLAKMEEVGAAIKQGFQEQSLIHGIKTVIQGKSPPAENPDPLSNEKGAGDGVIGQHDSMTYLPGEIKDVKNTVKALLGVLAEINNEIRQEQQKQQPQPPPQPPQPEAPKQPEAPREVELAVQSRGIKVSFDSRLLFESGSAALKPESRGALAKVAERLEPYSGKNLIQVEGHTDNQPIASAVYPSNWELSTARASAVVRYLVARHGFDPKYMGAAGFADSRPIADNKTAEGRAKNRRIDIIIYSKMAGNEADPKKQYQGEKTLNKPDDSLGSRLIEVRHGTEEGPVRVIFERKDDGGSTPKIFTPIDDDPARVKPIKIVPEVGETSKSRETPREH